jgi:hypothetical protein
MNSIYIKFTDLDAGKIRIKKSLWRRILINVLASFIPQGNPQFDDDIDNVNQWLIEFKNGNQYPNREVGLNFSQEPIMIMPWRRNYGYWIDNNLLLSDFKSRFNAIEISKEEFEKFWNEFEQQNENT